MLKDDIVFPDCVPPVAGLCWGMSTRNGGFSPKPLGMNLSFNVGDDRSLVERNRSAFFGALGIDVDRVAFPKQCHSATVGYAGAPGAYEATDGLITDKEDVWLSVSIADCLPVLAVDRRNGIIGAFHAGWKGTCSDIVSKGIGLMQNDFGVSPSDLVVFIGPSAGPCCYEVGRDVASQFTEEVVEERAGRLFLDLRRENVRQLVGQGIPLAQIEVNRSCTICTKKLFHSYRRDRERSGRMMAVIGRKG